MQKPYPPLFFGGSSERALEVAGKHIDEYLTWGRPRNLVAEKIAEVRKAAAKYGREIKFVFASMLS